MTEHWTGSAAVCINQHNQVLMVLQGKPEEEKKWSVPSGGRLPDESYEECCKREVFEETGLLIEVKEKLFIKQGIVHYFKVEEIGGKIKIQDPDHLIHDISWIGINEIMKLKLSFEEDRKVIINILKNHVSA